MKSHTYLEAVLTMNAVLLGALVWLNVSGSSATLPSMAVAQEPVEAFPNPDLQREELLRAIRGMSDEMRTMRHDMKTTEFKVRVVSMPQEAGGSAKSSPKVKPQSEAAAASEPMIQVTRVDKPKADDQ